MVDDSIRIGDYVSLYCEDSAGYIFSEGSRYDWLAIYFSKRMIKKEQTAGEEIN